MSRRHHRRRLRRNLRKLHPLPERKEIRDAYAAELMRMHTRRMIGPSWFGWVFMAAIIIAIVSGFIAGHHH